MRARFTRWYVKRGWSFDGDGFDCPWYIRPFLFLFSPSIYVHELMKKFVDGIRDAFSSLSVSLSNSLDDLRKAVDEFKASIEEQEQMRSREH